MKQYNIVRIQCDQCNKHYFVQEGQMAPQFTLRIEHECCMEKNNDQICEIATVDNDHHFCGFKCVRDYCEIQHQYQVAYDEAKQRRKKDAANMSDEEFDKKYECATDTVVKPVWDKMWEASNEPPLEDEVSDADLISKNILKIPPNKANTEEMEDYLVERSITDEVVDNIRNGAYTETKNPTAC